MARQISGLCSKAMQGLLTELATAWDGHASIQAMGGVDAARRAREAAGTVDVVVLAGGAMRKLAADGVVRPDSLTGIARSTVAVAVRAGEAAPDLADADAVRRAVLAAPRVGYSTGPSGDHLLALLDRWGIRADMADRLLQARPGQPVGRLLADGAVDLAFQQRAELLGVPGIGPVCDLPADAQDVTTFTAGIIRASRRAEAAAGFIAFLATPEAAAAKRRHGMQPA